MASGKRPPFSRLSESPPHSHGGGGDGITGGRAAGSGSGEVRGDRLNRSDQIARRDLYRVVPGHGFGFKKEKSADCHDGCVPKEVHERLLECLLEIEDFMADLRDSCKRNVSCTSDHSKGEHHELLCGSTLSSHWGRKSGGGREPAADHSKGEHHELLYGSTLSSHWGRKSGGGREPADHSKGEQHELLYGSTLSSHWGRKSGGGREPAADHSKGEQHELLYGSTLSYHWGRKSGGGREPAGRFPYASSSSYARPSADFRAPPVPPSHAPRARDSRMRSRSPTRGALPPKDYGGDLKMKRGRDDRHGPV